MKRAFEIVCVAAIVAALGSVASAVEIETVPVGNPRNAADTRYQPPGYGAVAYQYRIGKYEVTAGQYRDFLNAVDPNGANADGLYHSLMDHSAYGCQITWNSDSSTYDFSGKPSGTAADWQDRPVNGVSWYNAAMYANWATSGNIHQGAYDTSAGANWDSSTASAYTGITAHDSADMDALVSTYGRVYVIPSEDEWYKAAYYDPSLNSGAGGYYDYPTSSDSRPSNSLDLGGNNATFYYGGLTIGSPYGRTEIGAHENSNSPYGTFDQGGNVFEWNEVTFNGAWKGIRGGAFHDIPNNLHASVNYRVGFPWVKESGIGFRVAEIPEPATLTLLALGGLALLRRRRRK